MKTAVLSIMIELFYLNTFSYFIKITIHFK
jgi:hypothetical protein